MGTMSPVVREMTLDEVGLVVDYFHNSTPEHLETLGVDPTRLPTRRDWRASYAAEYGKPVEERSTLLVIWELDGVAVGFSTADKIVYGEQAHMRWGSCSVSPTPSTWRPIGRCRVQGSGTSRPTAPCPVPSTITRRSTAGCSASADRASELRLKASSLMSRMCGEPTRRPSPKLNIRSIGYFVNRCGKMEADERACTAVRADPAPPISDGTDPAVSDGRLQRGLRSRRTIVRHAVDMASMDGLNGLSIGRLATDLGLSKSGVQALFGSKENLQVATADFARDAFNDAVIRPMLSAPRGVRRLRALVEAWIVYAEAPLFAGGCFWAANLPDFDSRPGPVRDTLMRDQRDWRGLIGRELTHAVDSGEIADLDAELAAFQLDAVLIAANTAFRLGDTHAAEKVRRVLEGFLAPPA